MGRELSYFVPGTTKELSFRIYYSVFASTLAVLRVDLENLGQRTGGVPTGSASVEPLSEWWTHE